ncbi:MAG: hypothetical protein J6V24_00660 [Clostridia bacterium]|nr:hypothetical protein [Clostridia bacterium]
MSERRTKKKKLLWPTYDRRRKTWRVDFEDRDPEEGSLLYVAGEFARTGLYFPYSDSGTKGREYPGHAHSFEGVLRALLDDPEGFSVEGFEESYSRQELDMLRAVQEKLIGLKTAGTDDEVSPSHRN